MADVIQELMDVLHQELQWQQELGSVLEQKLDAMRHYDMSRLEALTHREQQLTHRIQLHEQKRSTAVQHAVQFVYPEQKTAWATIKDLAKAVSEPVRTQLLGISSLLKEAALKVQRLNQVNRIVSQNIMGHFNQIFQIIAQTGRDIGLYSRAGKKSMLEQNRLVDARA